MDRWLKTTSPDIYAAGDVVETTDIVTGQPLVSGLWTNAVEMGRVAGENLAAGAVGYPAPLPCSTLWNWPRSPQWPSA